MHEIAHAIDPETRIVYVDNDLLVLAHARALMATATTVVAIEADAADPASILDHPDTRRLINFDEPVGIIMTGLLCWLLDEQDPIGVTAYFRDRMSTGSYLLASSLLDDDALARDIEKELLSGLGLGLFRPWETHREYFDGLDLVLPGLVYANEWRPDNRLRLIDPRHGDFTTFLTGGCGRKP